MGLEVTEEVTIEREYDDNGNVTKEVRTVKRLAQPSARTYPPITWDWQKPNDYTSPYLQQHWGTKPINDHTTAPFMATVMTA
jgi:hypothetical protein